MRMYSGYTGDLGILCSLVIFAMACGHIALELGCDTALPQSACPAAACSGYGMLLERAATSVALPCVEQEARPQTMMMIVVIMALRV